MQGCSRESSLTLRPRLTGPLGLLFLAGVLGTLSWAILELASWEYAWWIVLPLWLLSALQVRTGLDLIKRRSHLFLTIAPDGFSFSGLAIARPDVVVVKKARELHFKGVRVEVGAGKWVGISATHHEPGRVIAAFRTQGYPVS